MTHSIESAARARVGRAIAPLNDAMTGAESGAAFKSEAAQSQGDHRHHMQPSQQSPAAAETAATASQQLLSSSSAQISSSHICEHHVPASRPAAVIARSHLRPPRSHTTSHMRQPPRATGKPGQEARGQQGRDPREAHLWFKEEEYPAQHRVEQSHLLAAALAQQ